MSQPQPPYQQHHYPPSGKASTWGPHAPAPKRGRGLRIVLLVVLGVLALVVVFGVIGALIGGDKQAPAAGGVTATATTVVKPAEAGGDGEFAVNAKVVDRKCGANGCDVTWVAELVYDGPLPKGDEVWTVSYKVVGAKSGTTAGKLLIGPKGPAKQNEKKNRVAAEGDQITLQVTGVDRG